MLTVHEPVQTIKARQEVAKKPITETMAEFKDLSNSKISNVYVKANAENDRTIQKVIQLVRRRNNAVIARLLSPWKKIQFLCGRFKRPPLHGQPSRHTKRYERKYLTGDTLRPCGRRFHVKRSGRYLVAPHS